MKHVPFTTFCTKEADCLPPLAPDPALHPRTDGMAPAPTPAATEMPVDMPVSLPGDPLPPSDMSYSFSFSFDMDDDDDDDGESPFLQQTRGQPRVCVWVRSSPDSNSNNNSSSRCRYSPLPRPCCFGFRCLQTKGEFQAGCIAWTDGGSCPVPHRCGCLP